jgi:hypothetical protein
MLFHAILARKRILADPLLVCFQVADEFIKRRGDTEW